MKAPLSNYRKLFYKKFDKNFIEAYIVKEKRNVLKQQEKLRFSKAAEGVLASSRKGNTKDFFILYVIGIAII